jgi:hypothetical protein
MLEAAVVSGAAVLDGQDPQSVVQRKFAEFRACAEARDR